MDESGDLGFNFKKKKTSKFFVVTFLLTKDKMILEKIVKKIFKGFTKTEVKNHGGILHAYKETPNTRMKILNLFNEKMAGHIITIHLHKKKVYEKLQNEKHILYNYVTSILLDRVCSKKFIAANERIELIASRRETNKFLNANFSLYLKNQVRSNHKFNIEITITHPSNEIGLQVVDMLCWSIFKKYEHNDDSYYKIIKQNIIEENPLFI